MLLTFSPVSFYISDMFNTFYAVLIALIKPFVLDICISCHYGNYFYSNSNHLFINRSQKDTFTSQIISYRCFGMACVEKKHQETQQ